jgi:hypothetical protein
VFIDREQPDILITHAPSGLLASFMGDMKIDNPEVEIIRDKDEIMQYIEKYSVPPYIESCRKNPQLFMDFWNLK